jgi:putative transposase
MKNLLTIYNPTGNQHIIKGNSIISLNEFYNKKINKLKSINKKKYNKNTFNRLQSLLKERENKINGFFNRVVNIVMETYKNKEQIIIGYNTGWKTKVNIGKKNNRRFYEIPYTRLMYKFIQKAKNIKKQITITKESYTSKCDSLNLEKINYHEIYDGKRVKRGLFSSKTKKLINADLNGAINIMRKKLNLLEVKGLNLFNPTILKL